MDQTQPLNPVAVEQEIRRLMNASAEAVGFVSRRLELYREAERTFDTAYAKAYLGYTGPAHERRYAADLASMDERATRDAAEVGWRYAEGRAKAIERELSGYQTINRTVAQMYSGAAYAGEGG